MRGRSGTINDVMAEIGRIDVDGSLGGAVLTLSGEFDLSNARHLLDELTALADRGEDRVVVDLGGATFMDSTALAAFALAYRMGLHLVLRSPSQMVRRELDTAGITSLFDLEE